MLFAMKIFPYYMGNCFLALTFHSRKGLIPYTLLVLLCVYSVVILPATLPMQSFPNIRSPCWNVYMKIFVSAGHHQSLPPHWPWHQRYLRLVTGCMRPAPADINNKTPCVAVMLARPLHVSKDGQSKEKGKTKQAALIRWLPCTWT